MNIQEVATRTGLPAYTIRFYEKSGLLPAIRRSDAGVRQFTEADVTFIQFVGAMRKTGMSLQDVAEYVQDGCYLERLQANDIPYESIHRRVSLLENHRERLSAQRRELEILIDAVNQKLEFYQSYLVRGKHDEREVSI